METECSRELGPWFHGGQTWIFMRDSWADVVDLSTAPWCSFYVQLGGRRISSSVDLILWQAGTNPKTMIKFAVCKTRFLVLGYCQL